MMSNPQLALIMVVILGGIITLAALWVITAGLLGKFQDEIDPVDDLINAPMDKIDRVNIILSAIETNSKHRNEFKDLKRRKTD